MYWDPVENPQVAIPGGWTDEATDLAAWEVHGLQTRYRRSGPKRRSLRKVRARSKANGSLSSSRPCDIHDFSKLSDATNSLAERWKAGEDRSVLMFEIEYWHMRCVAQSLGLTRADWWEHCIPDDIVAELESM